MWARFAGRKDRHNLSDLFLVTAPDTRSIQKAIQQNSGRPFTWVYLGQSIAEFHRARSNFEGHGTWLATTNRFHAVAEELRKPFLDYIYDIGTKIGSLHWWISSLSFRSGFSSKVFHQACYLRVALDLVGEWNGSKPLVLVVSDNSVNQALKANVRLDEGKQISTLDSRSVFTSRIASPVRSEIKLLAHRAWFLIREVYRWALARKMMPRRPAIAKETTLIISWATQANLSGTKPFHESYFGDLSTQLEHDFRSVAISPMLLKDVPYSKALSRFKTELLPVLPPHRHLSLTDLVSAAVRSCMRLRLPWPIPDFCGMDIGPLFREDLRGFRATNWAADVLLVAAVVRRWADAGISFDRIIYVYENQPWERALCWSARRHMPDTTLVGYQHARVPRFLLNLYFASGGETEAPLPHRVVTVGQHTANLLTADGYDPVQVRVAGALQMQELWGSGSVENRSKPPPTMPTVLVAPSSGEEEATELVDMAMNLFGDDEGINIVVKCHPLMPFGQAGGPEPGDLPRHIRLSNQPIVDLMSECSLMVYSGSTVCVQALSLGLPLIHVRPQFDLDLDPLEAAPDARPSVTGIEELRETIQWMLQNREQHISENRDSWRQLAGTMYGSVNEDTLRAFID